jgi:predicted metal-dependent phosphoesterase TrpH
MQTEQKVLVEVGDAETVDRYWTLIRGNDVACLDCGQWARLERAHRCMEALGWDHNALKLIYQTSLVRTAFIFN